MTTEDVGWVRAHTDDEETWDSPTTPVQQIDIAVHTHYLREYLQPEMRVLEMGAGAGRFTQVIAGVTRHSVVADRSSAKLALNQRNAQALGYVDAIEAWCECDMIDLRGDFGDDEFDAVVCLGGPLSYAFDRREKAIGELYRVTKPGGLLILSARSLFGALHQDLPRILNIDPRINREIIETGNLGPAQVALATRYWHAYRADEFRAFVEQTGARVLLMSASNCLSSTWGDVIASWQTDARRWSHLIELELVASREPGCLDMGAHILAIARKPA
ncbi:MAG: class I SAM-dependent methyltransferase [Anaerolineales bacterium]